MVLVSLSSIEYKLPVENFPLPKPMFRASVLPGLKDLIKEVDSLFDHFIWDGKEKKNEMRLYRKLRRAA